MPPIDKLSWDILNATADDWENLEQIYLALAYDVHDEHGAAHLEAVPGAPSLEEIADRLADLVASGHISVTREGKELSPTEAQSNGIWRGWFRMTPKGRALWQAAEIQGLEPAR